MGIRNRLLLAVSAGIFACFATSGQEAEPEVVFRSGTRLVQVDVVVKAKDVPVEGLTKQDFEVYDRGKLQSISIFSVRKTEPNSAPLPPLPKGVVTNVPRARGPEPLAATILLIDYLNTPTELQMLARQQAVKYLASAAAREHIAVYTLNSTLKVKQNFSDDPVLLRTTIEKTRPEPQVFEPTDFGPGGAPTGMARNGVTEINNMMSKRKIDITTAAFATVARHMSGLPGRKKLVWISTSLPVTIASESTRNDVVVRDYENLSGKLYSAAQLLNNGNIALYGVDPTPVGTLDMASNALGTMIEVAKMTGGKAYYGGNDLGVKLNAALSDTDYTYTLGFYPGESEPDPTVHQLQVKLTRRAAEMHPGSELRHRQTYLTDAKPVELTEKRRKQILEAWLEDPLDATEIAFTARAVAAPNRPMHRVIEVGVDISQLQLENKNGRWIGEMRWAVVPDGKDKPKGQIQTVKLNLKQETYQNLLTTGLVARETVPVANDKGKLLAKTLAVAVLDAGSGKIGTVRIPLESER